MQNDVSLAAYFGALSERLNDTDLIVGEHHGDQDRIVPDGICKLVQTDLAGRCMPMGMDRE